MRFLTERLLKITVTTKRSDRHEYAEYIFDAAERLIFCLESNGDDTDAEHRYYFASGRLIAAMSRQTELSIRRRTTAEAARSVQTESRKFFATFRDSLE